MQLPEESDPMIASTCPSSEQGTTAPGRSSHRYVESLHTALARRTGLVLKGSLEQRRAAPGSLMLNLFFLRNILRVAREARGRPGTTERPSARQLPRAY